MDRRKLMLVEAVEESVGMFQVRNIWTLNFVITNTSISTMGTRLCEVPTCLFLPSPPLAM